MKEPVWLDRPTLEHLHLQQAREHGGGHGLRDEQVLEAVLARPRNKWLYEETPDLALLAAAYGYGLARGHPFLDGNKRTAFMSIYVFLGLNGRELDTPEAEVVSVMLDLASGDMEEERLAEWVRTRMVPWTDPA